VWDRAGALGELVGRAQSTNRGRGQWCPLCVLVEGIQDCSRVLRINDVDPITAYGVSTFAALAIPRDGSESPGVGGSIPSLTRGHSSAFWRVQLTDNRSVRVVTDVTPKRRWFAIKDIRSQGCGTLCSPIRREPFANVGTGRDGTQSRPEKLRGGNSCRRFPFGARQREMVAPYLDREIAVSMKPARRQRCRPRVTVVESAGSVSCHAGRTNHRGRGIHRSKFLTRMRNPSFRGWPLLALDLLR